MEIDLYEQQILISSYAVAQNVLGFFLEMHDFYRSETKFGAR